MLFGEILKQTNHRIQTLIKNFSGGGGGGGGGGETQVESLGVLHGLMGRGGGGGAVKLYC